MAIKKYVSLSNLTSFLDNLKSLFATKTEINAKADKIHTHSISDVSGLQTELNNKAPSSHGTHVTYSATAPLMDGTASVGTASTVSRSDHKHPTDTSRAAQTSLDSHTSNTTSHITSTERTNWGTAYTHSQSAHAPSNAEKNQNAFSNVVVGSTTIAADSITDTLTLVAGSNITITPDATNDKITITAKDTTYSLSSFGITATAAELNKLDGVTATATEINYVDGVTSNIQTQLDNKAAKSHTHTVANISDLTATATELNYMDGVTSSVQTQLDGKAASGHTHNYAGSSSAGGAATSANKLNTNAGSATQPVYFLNGVPVATTYTLGKSVPSNAVFTDTTYSTATTSANGLMSSTDKKRVDSISGDYSLGSFASKTVADLQTALDTWLNSYTNIANSSAKFQASQDWITAWNSGNTATTISAGGTWTVTNIAPYSTKAYAQLRISYYSDEWVVYIHRSNGTWGAAHQVAFKDDLTLKQDTITGGASTIATSNLTASRALISNSSGKVAVSAVTSTELGYLDGVTSNVQTQLDGKAASSHNHSASNITSGTLSSDRFPTVPISKGGTGATTAAAVLTNLGVTATATELNYVDGVTSNIQTQLNNKAASSHTHNYAGSSSAGGAATSANKLNTNAGDANTPVYFSNGVPVVCTSLDLNTTGSSASCTGNSVTATKLQTARTIGLGTGATGTATSFNGSANITIPVTAVKESYLSWGGKNLSGSVSPLDAACSNVHSANRFAFAKAAGITIEYSTNGSTYSTYSTTDSAKISLVSGIGSAYYIGARSSSTTVNDKLRITLNATNMGLYTRLQKLLINISTNYATGSNVIIEKSMKGSESTYTTVGTYQISGWSGWNSIPISAAFGGGDTQTYNIANIRLTFGITGVNSSQTANALTITDIVGIGDTYWSYPSTMAKTGHIYTYDSSQNTTFPASVTAPTFSGSGVATVAEVKTYLGI